MNQDWSKFRDRSAFAKIVTGVLDWKLIRDFSFSEPKDSSFRERMFSEVDELFDRTVDTETVEKSQRLPEEFLKKLRKTSLNQLSLPNADGGIGGTRMDRFRIFEYSFSKNIPAGFCVAGTTAFGIGSILEALADGPAKDYIVGKIQNGCISGFADTEPGGAANRSPTTTAKLTSDGSHYLLSGRKVYINNGSTADVLLVSATVGEPDSGSSQLFVVDTKTPGFSIEGQHELIGLKGAPIATIRFDEMRVPADRRVVMNTPNWRDTLLLSPLIAVGRLYSLGSAALAMAKCSFSYAQAFTQSRVVDGIPLCNYDEIARSLHSIEADIYAIDSVAEWCLIEAEGSRVMDRWWELYVAKNITTMTLAGIVDRTVSLLGAEGCDGAGSKSKLGLPPYPVEKLYRDARTLRISGGVDFFVDYQSARNWLRAFYYNPAFTHEVSDVDMEEFADINPLLHQDLLFIQKNVSKLNEKLQILRKRYSDFESVLREERLLIVLNRIATLIFAVSIVLGKSGRPSAESSETLLGRTYCRDARPKLQQYWGELEEYVD